MPASRKRRRRTPAPDRLRRRGRPAPTPPDEECFELTGPEIVAQIDEIATPEDVTAFSDYIDAEAAGDPVLAAECYRRGLQIEGTPHLAHLAELVDLGEEAPSWALARWATGQAHRWMLFERDPRIENAVLSTIVACYPEVVDERPLGLSFTEFGTRLASSDWIAGQIAVYETDGLADFLDVKISDGLLARCGPLTAWTGSELGGYRIRRGRHGFLDVRDLRDGSRHQVLDIGALVDRGSGCPVLGRLMPIDVEPGLVFESRPLDVDDETALGVARADGPEEWMGVLRAGREEGRLPLHFSQAAATPLTSDIVPLDGWGHTCRHDDEQAEATRSAAPAILELEARGLDPLRANNIGVCDIALGAAEVSPDALAVVGSHLQVVLTDRRTFEAAKVHRTRPEDAERWAALATVVAEPVRSRCLELASLSRRTAA